MYTVDAWEDEIEAPKLYSTGCSLGFCKPRETYGREMCLDLHPCAYESVFLPPKTFSKVIGNKRCADRCLWWLNDDDSSAEDQSVRSFVDNDELGMYYIKKYIQFQATTVRWYHVIVRAPALYSFFEELKIYNARQKNVFLLEFSCWCDGVGKSPANTFPSTKYRDLYHRHMIAIVRDGNAFKRSCWSKVKYSIFTSRYINFKCKALRNIATWQHLRNVIYSVSSIKSKCIFGDNREEDDDLECKSDVFCENNYFIFAPLCPEFKFCAALGAFDGLRAARELVDTLKSLKRVTPYARYCKWTEDAQTDGGKYCIAIGHIVQKQGLSTLISRCRRFHRYFEKFLFWGEGRSLDAGKSPLQEMKSTRPKEKSNLPHNSKGGDDSYDLIEYFFSLYGREYWYPQENVQKLLREVVPLMVRMDKLEDQLRETRPLKTTTTSTDNCQKNGCGSYEEKSAAYYELKNSFLEFVNAKWRIKEREMWDSYTKEIEEWRKNMFENFFRLNHAN